MRDPKRIHDFCKRLEAAWLLVPDLRFGQLLMNVASAMSTPGGLFYAEDDALIAFIEKYISRQTGVPLK